MFYLSDFSKYRTQLMGVAAILILLCHSWYCIEYPPLIKYVIVSGNIGVDIFLVLSGIGLFFSLGKRIGSLSRWYCHRFLRIGIPFVLIIGAEYLFALSIGEINISRYILTMTTLGYWFHHDGAWFVSLLVPLYLLSPWLYNLRNHKNGILLLLLILLLCVFIGKLDVTKDNNNFFYNFTFALQRCPSFVLGFIIAPWVKCGHKFNIFILLLIGFFLKFILSRFCGVYGSSASFVLVIPICACICCFSKIKSKCESSIFCKSIGFYIGTCLSYMGKISLESYLTNSLLLRIVLAFSLPQSGYLIYLIVIILGIIMSIYINKLSNFILNLIYKK